MSQEWPAHDNPSLPYNTKLNIRLSPPSIHLNSLDSNEIPETAVHVPKLKKHKAAAEQRAFPFALNPLHCLARS